MHPPQLATIESIGKLVNEKKTLEKEKNYNKIYEKKVSTLRRMEKPICITSQKSEIVDFSY